MGAAEPVRVLVADPPWPFRDKLSGGGRGAVKKYGLMDLERICSYPLPQMHVDSVLMLWRVAAMQSEALSVASAWGFEPKAEIVWVKRRSCSRCSGTGKLRRVGPRQACYIVAQCDSCNGVGSSQWLGMGWNTRGAHETCLICTRGRNIRRSTKQAASTPSVFEATVPLEPGTNRARHSAKPAEFYDIVETLYPGPYHELFARGARAGWRYEGDEAWTSMIS